MNQSLFINHVQKDIIDLHVHTNQSDGEFSPKEIVHLAKESGISTIAITDHDTISGIEEAYEEDKRCNV